MHSSTKSLLALKWHSTIIPAVCKWSLDRDKMFDLEMIDDKS